MSDGARPTPTGEPARNEQQTSWFQTISRMLLIYFAITFFFKKGQQATTTDQKTGKVVSSPGVLTNLYRGGEMMDLLIYMSPEETFTNFRDEESILWKEKGIVYEQSPWSVGQSILCLFNGGCENTDKREKLVSFPVPRTLRDNGTLYAHVYFVREGYTIDPSHPNYQSRAVLYGRHGKQIEDVESEGAQALNKHMPQRKEVVKKNLISGEIQNEAIAQAQMNITDKFIIVNHWKTNLTINLVADQTAYPKGGIPPQFSKHMRFDREVEHYYPVVFFNEFWLFKDHHIAINNTVETLSLTLSYETISFIKWTMFIQIEESLSMQKSMGTSQEGDSEEMKRMFTDTNPYLLALTIVVSTLHSVFDFLAFKNDIAFWKNKKTFEGMSVRSMMLNCVFQVIIFLYLLDNSAETNWLIVISSGVGLFIEFWKLKKAMIIEIDWSQRIPIRIRDRESYAAETREYDMMAMKYLSWALYPLIVCYAIYSLLYDSHKSWYSFVLGTLTGCVYTFGFIMMCPQLFINYKLKSVAHLPFRSFMYKALNTVIDDLFAFIIKMPLLRRLSCFSDDIVFLIFLYQRWIYPVDKSRVNEFGQGGEEETAVEGADKAALIEGKEAQSKKED
ncbi:hypothetical protein PROFUN_12006 [Planoprotostelium fungivorum]|uniref:Uncharacterized protein n=1 Tax=Planoprotostelium fungivorum TaxID=1890364 RepID=A0A2P6MRC9_9EUKA|nr:hypothetical protein PROFUN_12006 [Planoprotostelium fungivorum]